MADLDNNLHHQQHPTYYKSSESLKELQSLICGRITKFEVYIHVEEALFSQPTENSP